MTFTDMVSRIQTIQTQMDTLSGLSTTATTAAASTTSSDATSATGFANVLSATKGQKVTASAGTLVDNGTTGQDIVTQARKYLGVPYVFGGTTSAGLDCSGLVQRVYGDLGIDVPRLVSGQGSVGVEVPSLADAQPGDIITTKGNKHVVIYAGNGKVIHAPDVGRNVTEVNNWLTDSDILSIRRIVPTTSTTQAATATAAPTASQLSALLGNNTGSGILSGQSGNTQASQIAALLSMGANTSQLQSLYGGPSASQQGSLLGLLAGGSA